MLLKNATILNGEFHRVKGDLLMQGETIVQIGEQIEAPGEQALDCSGKLLVPGLIDIHTHGAVGCDHSSGDPEALRKIAEYEGKNGVTAFLPTTMTISEEAIRKAAVNVRDYCKTEHAGATPLGVHMEGPFFSQAKRGAQPPEWIREPDAEMFRRLNAACGGMIKIVDVAPEVDGALEFIRAVKGEAVVSVAHTAADYDQTRAAFEAGASHAIHLYNGMTGATHRAPGVVGAVWDTPDVTAELICDGIHIHPAMLRSTFRLLGRRVVMISDSLEAAGMPDGARFLDAGGHEITVTNGKATLADGTIAGSSTNLMECVRRVIGFGVELETAFYAASFAPAKVIGCEKLLGSLEPGKRADVVILDEALQPAGVFIKGKRLV
ncbi:MAG: N-acetylglucosamine-6-phosphate deacetylase [Firmicutes bacterium]|nr:N-acetylglucosamine-6-phosphate deacetylase [Bacillota bacterium]